MTFQDPRPKTRNLFRSWAAAAALVCSVSGFQCSKPLVGRTPAKMSCYGYENKELKVYAEDQSKQKGELGKEHTLSFSELQIKDDSDPLAYFCTNDTHLFWVTKDTVYIREFSLTKDKFTVKKILDYSHIQPDEYAVEGVRVISADLWRNPDAPWQKITVATLTNTGLFQVSRYSLKILLDGDIDRGITDLSRNEGEETKWPVHLSHAIVNVLEGENFVIIPLGKKGEGGVKVFYHLSTTDKPGVPLSSKEMTIDSMMVANNYPNIKNIFEISAPVRYDPGLGGWVVNLKAETQDGKEMEIFPIVTPNR